MIADLAARQHEAVARRQLLALDIGRRAIGHRIAVGRLHVKWPGVYAHGHPRLTLAGMWMAAVLASGEGAVLSHRSAAMLWGLLRTDRARIEVTSARAGRARAGIQRHRAQLRTEEVTVRNAIPDHLGDENAPGPRRRPHPTPAPARGEPGRGAPAHRPASPQRRS